MDGTSDDPDPSSPKLLAEWFWTDRWSGSSAFMLSLEARGLYREMLTQAWRRDARLPNDPEAIRRATGTTVKEWARSWPKIKKYWRVDGDSLVNDTQLEIFLKAQNLSEHRRRAGSKGGSKAAANRQANAIAKSQPLSPSLSLTQNERQNERTSTTGGLANPLMAGRRPEMESEALRLTREISALNGNDPLEVFAAAAHYDGAKRQKVNPAALSDDRLANTLIDLRATLSSIKAKQARA